MEDSIDAFIRFLAVERGLSENYQLSTQRSLSEFAEWCGAKKKITHPRGVTLPVMSEYLARPQTGRPFGLFDQAGCGCAQDFFSVSRRQDNHRA